MQYYQDIKDLTNMVKSMNESIDDIYSIIKDDFYSNYGFKITVIDSFEKIGRERIENWSDTILLNLYNKYYDDSATYKYPENYDERVKLLHKNILLMYDDAQSLFDMFNDRDKIMKQVEEAQKTYHEYISSDEYKEKENLRYNQLKQQIEDEHDIYTKKKMQSWIDAIDGSENLTFIFDRFEKLGDKELENIVTNFFNKSKSDYIIKKFNVNVKRLGFTKNVHLTLLDIEENFLGEDYYCFNNLFLFISIRFIAYANLTNKEEDLYARGLILKLVKLVYHRFKTPDEEKEALNIIRSIDDQFEKYRDKFIANNKSDPRSEYRKSMEVERVQKSIDNIRDWYTDHDLKFPEELSDNLEKLKDRMKYDQECYKVREWLNVYDLEYPEDATLDELNKIYNVYMNPVPEAVADQQDEDIFSEADVIECIDVSDSEEIAVEEEPDTESPEIYKEVQYIDPEELSDDDSNESETLDDGIFNLSTDDIGVIPDEAITIEGDNAIVDLDKLMAFMDDCDIVVDTTSVDDE